MLLSTNYLAEAIIHLPLANNWISYLAFEGKIRFYLFTFAAQVWIHRQFFIYIQILRENAQIYSLGLHNICVYSEYKNDEHDFLLNFVQGKMPMDPEFWGTMYSSFCGRLELLEFSPVLSISSVFPSHPLPPPVPLIASECIHTASHFFPLGSLAQVHGLRV